MFKTYHLASLCLLMIFSAPAAIAQVDTDLCNQLTAEVEGAQEQIDVSRVAYERSATDIDARIGLANEAAQNGENLDTLWANVLLARDNVLPLAQDALKTLNTGFALMQNYVQAGCTTMTAAEVEQRRIAGASHYEDGIKMLNSMQDNWNIRYAEMSKNPDPATCMALDSAHKEADAKAKAHSLKHDDNIAAYNKARLAVNLAIDLEQDFTTEWETLLLARRAAMPGIDTYRKVISATFDPVKKGFDNGCIQMSDADKIAFEKNTTEVLKEISGSKISIINMRLVADAYVERRKATTTARIGIINNTDQILCIYRENQTKGKCNIKPNGSQVVELQSKEEQETEESDDPAKVFVITNNKSWLKTADGETRPQEISICAKRTFEHKSGSQAWIIEAGVEEGCTRPAADE